MSVNLNIYQSTIDTLTTQNHNLYLKKLDNTGKLIDVCLLIKLFRIIAHCLGFYTNANAAKELKLAVAKQLTPHFPQSSPLKDESDRFAIIATKVQSLLNPPKDSQEPTIPDTTPTEILTHTTLQTTDNQTTTIASVPLPDSPSPSEILAEATIKKFFTLEETQLLLEQETLDLTHWVKPINLKLTFLEGNIHVDLPKLLRRCKKLKTVTINDVKGETHKTLSTVLLSYHFQHLTINAPLIPLIHSPICRDYEAPHGPYPALAYFRKYATTPELRKQLFSISFSPELGHLAPNRFDNISLTLAELCHQHPKEAVEVLSEHISKLYDHTGHVPLNRMSVLSKFKSSLFPELLDQLLHLDNKDYFLDILRFAILQQSRDCPPMIPIIEAAMSTFDWTMIFFAVLDTYPLNSPELRFVLNELKQMDNKKFFDYLNKFFQINKLDKGIYRIITRTPRCKIPALLEYAASRDPKYAHATLESLALSYRKEVTHIDPSIFCPVAALVALELIALDPPDLPIRLKNLFQTFIRTEMNLFAEELGKQSNANEIERIFLVFGNFEISRSTFSYYFFKGIFNHDCTTKVAEAITKFWHVKHQFFSPNEEGAIHAFCEIATLKTVNTVLIALKPFNTLSLLSKENKELIGERAVLAKWITALFFTISLPVLTSSKRAKYVSKLNKNEITFCLELHQWLAPLLVAHQQAKLAKFHQEISPTTTLDNWLNQLKQCPTISKKKELLPQQLPPEITTLIFDYWILPQ